MQGSSSNWLILDFYMNFIAFINNFLDYDYYLMNISLITMSTYIENVICEKSPNNWSYRTRWFYQQSEYDKTGPGIKRVLLSLIPESRS